jgi:hypothetical protein
MWENEAIAVAAVLGGEPYHSGGGCWLVVIQKRDTIVVISEDAIGEVADPKHEGALCDWTNELSVINLYDEGSLL